MLEKLFYRKSWLLWDNVGKYVTARKATVNNKIRHMRISCWIAKATDTHSEYVIIIISPECFSTTNAVAIKSINVTLCLHCLSFYSITARTEWLYLHKLSDNYHLFHAVASSWNEPFPGWVDNFNGPFGLLIAGGKGIVRTLFADPNAAPDYIPIDICIQFLLLAAWCKAVGR